MTERRALDNIRVVVDNAKPLDDEAPPAPPPPDEPPPARRVKDLPPDFPIVPLGLAGSTFFYLDAHGQLHALQHKDHGRLPLIGLVGDPQVFWDFAPRKNDEGHVTGWRPEVVAEALMHACAKLGLFDARERIRGPGAWRGDGGELLLHVGGAVLSGATTRPCGRIGEHVYPAFPPLPRPIVGQEESRASAATIKSLLQSWAWRRPALDPLLLLGWIAAARLGGALNWRPMAWITGDRATGKSTLHEALGALLGPWLLRATDASAAGVWQTLGHSALPVALDEIEADADPRKAQAIVTLARHAASGGRTLRGGADHKSTDFTARSCFLFSSILIPPLSGQDLTRLAIFELQPLPAGARSPKLDPGRLAVAGALLLGRLVEAWPELPARLETWREALTAGGHGGRGADQFGTLLALADLALHPEAPSGDEIAETVAPLTAAALADGGDDAADHERCLAWLLSSAVEVFREGRASTVAMWVQSAAADKPSNELFERTEADKVLGSIGLKVLRVDAELLLAVAGSHQGLARLFAGSHWAARSGASGVWRQALARVEGARKLDCIRFGGVKARAIAVPLAAILPPATGQGA